MKHILLIFSLLGALNSAQAFDKDRGGGDEVGLDFQKSLQVAAEEIRVRMPSLHQELEKSGFSTKIATAKVIVADESLGVAYFSYLQYSVAANIPDANTIFVNRKRWLAISDYKLKKAIALHEGLSLVRLEGTGNYSISSKYLADQGLTEKYLNAALVPLKGKTSGVAPRGIPRFEKSLQQQRIESAAEAEKKMNAICDGYFAKADRSTMLDLLGNAIYAINSYLTELDSGKPEYVQADAASDELMYILREATRGVNSNYNSSIKAYCEK